MTIDELKQAVQDFYGDTSRSQEETRDALEELASDLEAMIDSLS
jgi:uncharacterized protein YukE